jgi:hypothetical protein
MLVEKRKNESTNPYAQGTCPVCGGSNFEWGRLAGQINYYSGINFWQLRNPKVIAARHCLQCNNLLEELTRKWYRLVAIIIGAAILFSVLITLVALAAS